MNHNTLKASPITTPSPLGANSCPLLDYLSLGASLYMPATRPTLSEDLRSEKLRGVRSVILCTEDAIAEREVPLALERLAALLREPPPPQALYMRPRSPELLSQLLKLPGVEKLSGLVLPKVDEWSCLLYTSPSPRDS